MPYGASRRSCVACSFYSCIRMPHLNLPFTLRSGMAKTPMSRSALPQRSFSVPYTAVLRIYRHISQQEACQHDEFTTITIAGASTLPWLSSHAGAAYLLRSCEKGLERLWLRGGSGGVEPPRPLLLQSRRADSLINN